MNEKLIEKLEKIANEATDCTILHTINYGDIEAWNYVCCQLQNAAQEKNSVIAHIESSLCYESDDTLAFFAKLGIKP